MTFAFKYLAEFMQLYVNRRTQTGSNVARASAEVAEPLAPSPFVSFLLHQVGNLNKNADKRKLVSLFL